MFKRVKVRKETRLIRDAVDAGEWDKLDELMEVERKEEFKQWVKGFLSGYGSAVTGLVIGTLIGNVIKRKSGDSES